MARPSFGVLACSVGMTLGVALVGPVFAQQAAAPTAAPAVSQSGGAPFQKGTSTGPASVGQSFTGPSGACPSTSVIGANLPAGSAPIANGAIGQVNPTTIFAEQGNGTVCLAAELPQPNLPGGAFDSHQPITLSGWGYDAAATGGATGIDHVEVFLNTQPGQPGAFDLGTANLLNAAGVRAPAGFTDPQGFSFILMPQNPLPSPLGVTPTPSNQQTGWPKGGNTLYVYAYSTSGGSVYVSIPFFLQ